MGVKGYEMSRSVFSFFLMAVVVAMVSPARGHQINTSYTSVAATEDRLRVTVTLDEADLLSFFGLDGNGDGVLWYGEMKSGATPVFDYAEERTSILIDGEAVALTRMDAEPRLDKKGTLLLDLGFESPLSGLPATIEVQTAVFERLSPDHRNLVDVTAPELEPQVAVLSREVVKQRFVLREPGVLERVGQFTRWGVEHIFFGYDHIMFLLALIVIGGSLRGLVKIVSAFTVAHSITLILAALEVVVIPGRLIESGIALSIAYVALENFWVKDAGHRWMLTFFFGLVHGFGFANVLLDLGLPSKGLIASLLAFNVGVELGQVAIVAILFPLVYLVGQTQHRQKMVSGVSAIVFLFGLGWLIERVFGLSYMPF